MSETLLQITNDFFVWEFPPIMCESLIFVCVQTSLIVHFTYISENNHFFFLCGNFHFLCVFLRSMCAFQLGPLYSIETPMTPWQPNCRSNITFFTFPIFITIIIGVTCSIHVITVAILTDM